MRKRVFRLLLWILLIIALLITGILVAIRMPTVQQRIASYAVTYLSEKTESEIQLQRLFLTFDLNLQMEGLAVFTPEGDSLAGFNTLEVGVSFWPLLKNHLEVNVVRLDGLYGNIQQWDEDRFNFSFLIDAFSGDDEDDELPEETDSESKEWTFSWSAVTLSNIDLNYSDHHSCRYSVAFEELHLDPEIINWEKGLYHFKKIHWTRPEVDIELCERPNSEPDNDTTSTPLHIRLGDLQLKDLDFKLRSKTQVMHFNWASLSTNIHEFDLQNQIIDISTLELSGLTAFIQSLESGAEKVSEPPTQETEIELPHWTVKLNRLNIDSESLEIWQMDTLQLDLLKLDWKVENIAYRFDQKKPEISIHQKSLYYQSTTLPEIAQLQFDLETNDRGLGLNAVGINAFETQINFSGGLNYNNLTQELKTPNTLKWYFELEKTSLNTKHFFDLIDTTNIPAWVYTYPWSLGFKANGEGLEKVSIENFSLMRVDGFNLRLNAEANSILDSVQRMVSWNIKNMDVQGALLKNLKNIYAAEEENFPKFVTFQSRGRFKSENISGRVRLLTDRVKLTGTVATILGQYQFNGDLDLLDIVLGENHLTKMNTKIQLTTLADPLEKTNLQLDIGQLEFNDKPVEDIHLTAKITQRNFEVNLISNDPHAKLNLEANGRLDTHKISSQLEVHLQDFHAHYFGLSESYIIAQTHFRGDIDFRSIDDLHARIDWDSLFFQQQDQRWDYKNVYFELNSTPEQFKLDLDFQDVQSRIQANAPISEIEQALRHYINGIIGIEDTIADSSLELTADVRVYSGAVLELLGTDYRIGEDTLILSAGFRQHPKAELTVDFSMPDFSMPGIELKLLTFQVSGNDTSVTAGLAITELEAANFDIGDIQVDAGLYRRQINLDFANYSEGIPFYRLKTQTHYAKDSIVFTINPDSVILSGEKWDISPNNAMVFGQHITVNDWILAYKNASIGLSNADDQKIRIDFQRFDLRYLSALLDEDNPPVEGNLGGFFTWNPIDKEGDILGDISIDSLYIFGEHIGRVDFLAEQISNEGSAINLTARGPNILMHIDGFYRVEGEIPLYDLELAIERLDLKLLEAYGGEILNDTRGHIKLTTIIQGKGNDLEYGGTLQFYDAGFTLAATKSAFTLSDEIIRVRDKSINFERFTLLDKDNQPLNISGDISLEQLNNPAFDIKIKADKFSLLNSKREDNDLFYGDLLIGAEILIGGDLNLPQIEMTAKLQEGTKVTFVVPESEVSVTERESVVQIVDRSIPDSLRNPGPKSTLTSGFSMRAKLQADPSTTFRVIIDEQAGDMLEISGEANLSLNIDESGQMQMTGLYEVSGGFYQLNFYDVVQRKFTLTKGSNVRWNGDPLYADLQLEAVYSLRTSPLDLMIDQIGPGPEAQQPYRREQPFEVLLKIGGELLQPELQFGIDMPEQARGAINGTIYSRLQQLGQNENELNQQTFSLLVLGQFIPGGQTAGSGPSASGIARSSASRMLSQQLNNISGRYIKSIDLDLGLESYSGEAGEDRTDLQVRVGKRFMDNRLKVEVGGQFELEGSQEGRQGADQFMGDVNIEYLLTEDGRYRLKAFRKNEWQGMVEGQIISTGAAIIFKRDFDSFEELVRAMFKKGKE
ncbi:MAG: translocation/assembly module TamB domain-containing protein [Cryomorphaceae bacterium]|nr:translocation/assembly module TamB domain-containing protein [Cryomorphaceae bacterium]